MADILEGIAGLVIALLLVCGLIILSPLMGAFVGYILSLAMPGWLTTGLNLIGIKATASDLPALGATLAFIGSFFKFSAKDRKPKAD